LTSLPNSAKITVRLGARSSASAAASANTAVTPDASSSAPLKI